MSDHHIMHSSKDYNGLLKVNSSHNTTRESKDGFDTEGCIILGTDTQRGNRYISRFRIDPYGQQSASREGICAKECYPCLNAPEEGKTHGPRKFFWDFLRSEAFLLTIHIAVLILGVTKEALNLRIVAEDIHLAHSVVETFVSIVLTVIRVVSAWHAYNELIESRAELEVITDKRSLPIFKLKRGMIAFTIIAIILIIGDIVAFFVFKFVKTAHLGWTILTNNALLLYITVSSNQILGRIQRELAAIELDHHKAIIYESLLLLSEMALAKGKKAWQEVLERTELFSKALDDTESFRKPHYIACPDDAKPHWDAVTSMEVVSMV